MNHELLRIFKQRRALGMLWLAMILLLTPLLASAGNTYIYKDKKGRTHITNVPMNESGFKLVKTLATPVYKRTAAARAAEASGTIDAGGSGWKLIQPSGAVGMNAAILSKIGKQKLPFNINNKKRLRYAKAIIQAARKYKLDPYLVHAVISAESAYNPKATSHAGAMGLMQLMPATAERFGVSNAYDPVANINGGTRYLRWLLNYFKGNINLALAGYNAGEGAVVKYKYKIPPYKETQTYVARVLKFYHHYRNLGKSKG